MKNYYGKEVTVAGRTFTIPDDAYISEEGIVSVWFSDIYGFRRVKKRRYGVKSGHVLLEGGAYAQAGVKPDAKRSGWYVTFGLTDDSQEALNAMDEEDEKKERSEREHRDLHATASDGTEDENGDFTPSRFDKIAYKQFQQAANGQAPLDDRVVMIEETIENLQPQQQDLVWGVFGEKKKRADIARERGVSRAAITQAVGRIEAQCVKTCKAYGEDVPSRKEAREHERRMKAYEKQYEESLDAALTEWEETNDYDEYGDYGEIAGVAD